MENQKRLKAKLVSCILPDFVSPSGIPFGFALSETRDANLKFLSRGSSHPTRPPEHFTHCIIHTPNFVQHQNKIVSNHIRNKFQNRIHITAEKVYSNLSDYTNCEPLEQDIPKTTIGVISL